MASPCFSNSLHHPLAAVESGRFGADPAGEPGIVFTVPPQGHVVEVLAVPGAGALENDLAALARGAVHGVRGAGPDRWFLVGDTALSPSAFEAMVTGLAGRADLIDQSHGCTRITAGGPRAEVMLAKGTAVDLNRDAFSPGRSASTLIGHIPVHLTRTEPDCFELLVLRSFAESLWDDLRTMGLEYGVAVRTPDR